MSKKTKEEIGQRILQYNVQKKKAREKQENRLILVIIAILVAIILFFVAMHEREVVADTTCGECLDMCRVQYAATDAIMEWSDCNNVCFNRYGGMFECISSEINSELHTQQDKPQDLNR